MVKVAGGSAVTKINTKENDGPTITKGILTGVVDNPETKTDESITTKDDVEVSGTVQFRLDSKVPDMNGYSKYFYIVNDTLSKGMTFDANSVKVTVGDAELTKTENKDSTVDETYYIETTKNEDGTTSIKIVLCNFINYTYGDKIQIFYNATANKDIEVGNTDKNTNTASLTYTNNPNYDYHGTNEPGTNPDDPDDKTYDPVGTSAESTVYVYTAGIEIIKVDANENRLQGATFKIEAADGSTLNAMMIGTQTHTEAGYASQKFDSEVYYKEADGAFVSGAPTEATASMYASKVCVRYNEKGEVDINGAYYMKLGGTSTADLVAAQETTADTTKYESDYVVYTRSESLSLVSASNMKEELGKVGENGALIIDGLAAGTYKITEVTAPDGYNALKDPINVTIQFDPTATEVWSYYDDMENSKYNSTNVDKPASGIYEIHVVNKAGSTLPSTGGIGTTIFYTAGSLLVVTAGVVLVTKKRMKKADK